MMEKKRKTFWCSSIYPPWRRILSRTALRKLSKLKFSVEQIKQNTFMCTVVPGHILDYLSDCVGICLSFTTWRNMEGSWKRFIVNEMNSSSTAFIILFTWNKKKSSSLFLPYTLSRWMIGKRRMWGTKRGLITHQRYRLISSDCNR